MTIHTYEPANGGTDTFVVPGGVTSIHVWVYGAKGGSNSGVGDSSRAASGGLGGLVECDIAVTPGETLDLLIGESVADDTPTGGTIGSGGSSLGTSGAPCGGGGCSYIARSGTYLVVAGGGGGASALARHIDNKSHGLFYTVTQHSIAAVAGGAGGGGNGTNGPGNSTGGSGSGSAGTDGGNCTANTAATAGTTLTGGNGGKPATSACDGTVLAVALSGAGGGGGNPGGGGGGCVTYTYNGVSIGSDYGPSAGGGGTSTAAGGTGVTMTAGVRTGDGKIIIDDAYVPPVTATPWDISSFIYQLHRN